MSPAKGRGRPSARGGGTGRRAGTGHTAGSGQRSGSDQRAGSGRGTPAGRPARGRAASGRGTSGAGPGRPNRGNATRVRLGGDQVEGRQAVRELLAAGRRRVRSLAMADDMDPAAILDEIEALAARRKVRVDHLPRRRVDDLARTDGPQGVVATAAPVDDVELDALCGPGPRGRVPLLLVLDGITDPHNLGSLLRSAECAGVTGVVLPRHRSAHLSPTVAKVAAGAIEHLPMALVPGVPAALSRLSDRGVWTVGLDADAPRTLYELTLGSEPVALVLGSEGAGLSPLAAKRCDALVSVPQHGRIPSLNVAVAGAIACFDIARRRDGAG